MNDARVGCMPCIIHANEGGKDSSLTFAEQMPSSLGTRPSQVQSSQAVEVEDGVEGGGVAIEVILWRVAGRVAVAEGEDHLSIRARADQAREARRRQHREVFPHYP